MVISNFIIGNLFCVLSKKDWSKFKSENIMYDFGFDIKFVKGFIISG